MMSGDMVSVVVGRRSHRKSKFGCLACKRRKVKCDENKPACIKCTQHGVPCSFAGPPEQSQWSPTVASAPEPPRSERATEARSQSTIAPEGDSTSNLPIFDMELLHHYMVSTCYTLSRTPAVQAVWRDEAPRIAFTMPAVLHAMLAVSALHLAHCDPSKRESCITQAHAHHELAVRIVTPNLPTLATDNGPGLFLFSSLTCIIACADAPFILFEKGRLANWVLLFRGTKTVINYNNNDFSTGRLGPIFTHGSHYAVPQTSQALELGQMYTWELKQLIQQTFAEETRHRLIYGETLDALCKLLGVVLRPGEGHRLQTADIFSWLFEASEEYLELLVQNEPVALIIFGYFCVAVQQIEWMWFIKGLSSRLMVQVSAVIDDKYQNWLRWPMEQISRESEHISTAR